MPIPPREGASRPFPKTPEGRIDKERVRDEFMRSQALTIRSFAEESGFDRNRLMKDFPMKRWIEEKVALSVSDADEEALSKAVQCRKSVLMAQFKAVEQIPDALFGVLRLYQYMVRGFEEKAAADISARLAGLDKAPGWKPRMDMTMDELAFLASAGERLTNAIHKAVGLGQGQPAYSTTLMERVKNIAEGAGQEAQAESEQVEIKGMGLVDPGQAVAMLRQFYDGPGGTRGQLAPPPAPAQLQEPDPAPQNAAPIGDLPPGVDPENVTFED